MWLLNSTRLVALGSRYVKVRDDYESKSLQGFVDIDDSVFNIVSGIPNGSSLDLPEDYYEMMGESDESTVE